MKKVEDSKKSKARKFRVTVNSVLQKDVEFEDAGISASEDEEDDTRKHQKLLEAVQKLKGQKPTVTQRSEASQDISEFNLTEVGKEKVKLDELIKTLKQTTSQVSIKQQLRKVSKKKRLPVPLSKPQADKIKRTVAYSKVSEEVSKWDNVVKSNRSAEQIIYPLNQPEFRLETAEDVAKRKTVVTDLEQEISDLLKGSDNVLTQDRKLTVAEEKALKAKSVEEASMRHKSLQKIRALVSYQEAKARRQSKIKSKKYHRIQKKDKMKKMMKDFEELQQNDPDAAREKLDKQRIMERMGLKHRNTGKWAKYQKLRAKYNPESRESLKEQMELGRTLAQKITVPDGVNGTVDVTMLEKEDRQTLHDDVLLKLYASENNFHSYGAPSKSVDEVTKSETVIEKPSNVVPTAHLENDAEEIERGPEEDDDDAVIVDESMERKKTVEDFDELLKDDVNIFGKEKVPRSSKAINGHKKKSATEHQASAAADAVFYNSKKLESMVPNDITHGDENLDDDSDSSEEGAMNIQQAFADENLISEFREEKKAVKKREQPEGIDMFLPGWGSWGGAGIKPSKRKKKRFFIKAPILSRRDDGLGNVIINPEKDKKASAHQVTELPFPYSSVQQFESIIRQPIGNTWNSETSFKNLIAPKVITKAGKIIDPIDADALVLQKEVDERPSKLLKDDQGKLSLNKSSGKVKRIQKNKKLKLKFKK